MKDFRFHPSIDQRSYKLKSPKTQFYCPLCAMERGLNYGPRLEKRHYTQIFMISFCLIALTLEVMGAWSIIFFFLTWIGFEAGRRTLFKKEIPCPHCGFDATWYKRDVKVARLKVENFWKEKAPKPVEAAISGQRDDDFIPPGDTHGVDTLQNPYGIE